MAHGASMKSPAGPLVSDKGKIKRDEPSAYELRELPDHSTSAVRATEERLGPFVWDENDEDEQPSVQRCDRKPYELDNGAIYMGEWTLEGHRDGMGTQMWKDGSKYVGYWKRD